MFSFTPDFLPPAQARQVLFRLKKGPLEIAVDPKTGTLTWKPTEAFVGKFDIALEAVIDEKAAVPVLAWTLEVEF